MGHKKKLKSQPFVVYVHLSHFMNAITLFDDFGSYVLFHNGLYVIRSTFSFSLMFFTVWV